MCPNQFPTRDLGRAPGVPRVAFVGEAPGSTEIQFRTPFIGESGQLLNRLLGAPNVALPRETVFVGNVSQCQPARNEFDAFEWDGAEVQDGVAALLADLARFAPNLVVTMGNAALHLFMAGNTPPARRRKGHAFEHVWEYSVTRWRGSLFESSPLTTARCWPMGADPQNELAMAAREQFLAVARWKCLATIHPAFVLRSMDEKFNLRQDLAKARAEATTAALVLPPLDFAYGPAIATTLPGAAADEPPF